MINSISDIFKEVRRNMGIPDDMKVDYFPGGVILGNEWDDVLSKGYEIDADDSRLTWDDKGFIFNPGDGKRWRVHVYIRDQVVYEYDGDPKNYVSAYRFHVTHCATLESMKNSGRYGRYVICTSKDDKFKINLTTSKGTYVGIVPDQKLQVCRHCLRKTNYRNYAHVSRKEQNKIVEEFNLEDFYRENPVDDIHVKPKHTDNSAPINQYSPTWRFISDFLRKKYDYKCQKCHRDFKNNPKELHVHHIDGDKSNSALTNLMVLCHDCHKKFHPHMI